MKQRVIEIKPLSKWKRILLSLADWAISFILSFVLFNLAIFPLAKIIFNTEDKYNETVELEKASNALLVNNGILFSRGGEDDSFEEDVEFTFEVFLSYYAFDEEDVTGSPYSQYGHKEGNDVVKTYLINYLDNESLYLEAFNKVNITNSYFNIGQDKDSITLKDTYKDVLGAELLEGVSSLHTETYTNVRDNVFANLFYIYVYEDITHNDFVVGDVSYMGYISQIDKIYEGLDWLTVGSVLVSTLLSWAGIYLIYPLINKSRRTPSMSAFKVEKLNYKTLAEVERKEAVFHSFYHLILCFSYMIFLPALFFGLPYCFSLPLLFALGAIALLLSVASLFIILFNEYNRSGSDILSQIVIIPNNELDEMYRKQNEEIVEEDEQ